MIIQSIWFQIFFATPIMPEPKIPGPKMHDRGVGWTKTEKPERALDSIARKVGGIQARSIN